MRDRIGDWWNQQVTMTRWAVLLDFLWRMFVLVGACVVVVLWWQTATQNEEEDRNLLVQACASAYAATYDAHIGLLLEEASAPAPNPAVLAEEGKAIAELAGRRIGVAMVAAELGNDFLCPAIPERLQVEPVDPTDPLPPTEEG
jgi:hypothetical protein